MKAISLQPGDLPATWKLSGTDDSSSTSGSDGETAQLTKCVGSGKDTNPDQTAKYATGYALAPNSISSSATSYTTQSDVDADVALLKNPKLSTCFEQLIGPALKSSLPAGSTIGKVTVKVLAGTNGGASNVQAILNVVIPVTTQGKSIIVYEDVAFITGPKIEAQVQATGVGTQVPVAVFSAAVSKVAARAAKG